MSLENILHTPDDMEAHFWAYRVMNAVGVYDKQFKADYTRLIGSKIEALLVKRGGMWLQDNCLRNNASPDGKVMSGLYLFNGILRVYDTSEDRDNFITQRARDMGQTEGDLESYTLGYVLSVIHQNALLAGYRTQEARWNCEELLEQKKKLGGYRRETYHSFQKAHDEVGALAKRYDCSTLSIQSGYNNKWTKPWIRDNMIHLQLEVALQKYDAVAARLGFVQGEDKNWYREI